MARKHMAPPEASRSRSLRPLATTVPRRTEHPTKLAASVCPHRRHLNPSPQQLHMKPDFKREVWQGAATRLLPHPRSGTARKDPKANAAMESRESALPGILPRVLHYENIDILQPPSEDNLHQSEENLPEPALAGPRVPRPDAAVPAAPAA